MSFWDKLGDIGNFITAPVTAIAGAIQGHKDRKAQKAINNQNIDFQRETNDQQMRMFHESQIFNKEQSDLAYQRQLDMFNLENEYNNPVNIVKRLRDAGINPQIAMSGSLGSAMATSANAGTPAAATAPSIPSLTAPHADALPNRAQSVSLAAGSAAQLLSAISSFGLNKANKKKVEKETDILYETAADYVKQVQSETKQKEALAKIEEINAGLLAKYGDVKWSKEVQELNARIDKILEDTNLVQAQQDLNSLQREHQIMENNWLHEKTKRIEDYIQNEIQQQLANIKLTKEQAAALPKQVHASLVSAFAAAKQAEVADYLSKHPNDIMAFLTHVISDTYSTEEVGSVLRKVFDKVGSWIENKFGDKGNSEGIKFGLDKARTETDSRTMQLITGH